MQPSDRPFFEWCPTGKTHDDLAKTAAQNIINGDVLLAKLLQINFFSIFGLQTDSIPASSKTLFPKFSRSLQIYGLI